MIETYGRRGDDAARRALEQGGVAPRAGTRDQRVGTAHSFGGDFGRGQI